jgi:hypothetical protein
MNKQFLYQLLKSILQFGFKAIIFSLRFVLTIFFSSDLDKRIKANEKWESEYDELTTHVTKRKHFH